MELVDGEQVESFVGPTDIDFSVSVRFPVSDLPAILERLAAAKPVE